MWQEIVVGACVLAAALFLAWRWLPLKRRKAAGCDSGCSGCGSAKACDTEATKAGKS